MTKSVTVNFDDGSSHTYDNVPDTITDDQVRARAGEEFSDKTITGVGGTTAAPAEQPKPGEEPGVMTNIAGGLQTAWQHVGQPVVNFAMQHPIEAGVAASYIPGVNQLPGVRDVAAARRALYDRYIGQQQTFNALKQTQQTAQAAQAAAAEANPSAGNFIQRMSNLARQYGPAVQSAGESAVQAVKSVAPMAARIGGTAALALTPGNVGQNYNFPQRGPMRGSEINPQTGRPWTTQELQAYNAQY